VLFPSHDRAGTGHQQKPDIDNLVKALLDALHIEDKHIYHLADTGKWWADAGYIEVLINNTNR
jgi:Holliday junction resolvase RusA-like endonuclease